MKKKAIKVIPWLITLFCIYFALKGLDINEFLHHFKQGKVSWIILAFFLTFTSYIIRSYRWEFFFEKSPLSFIDATKVLFLGFFVNNILPARTGELVRAHAGATVSNSSRTLLLASIFNERLVDGLTLSLFFVYYVARNLHHSMDSGLIYVVLLFIIALISVFLILILQNKIVKFSNRVDKKLSNRVSNYAVTRFQTFIDGLKPLFMSHKIFPIFLSSILVWLLELAAYYCVAIAFSFDASLSFCVLFLVAVNFSSLIPSAPGAIGVIEAIVPAILAATGISRELGLSMVISQHIVQYLVVGIPGILLLWKWNKKLFLLNKYK